ncbi:MAG: ComEC/Rec2 family competence protein [Christensenellales bacterium]
MAEKKNDKNTNTARVAKSKSEQKKQLSRFAVGAAAAGAAVAAAAGRGKSKKTKKIITVVAVILVLAVIACGALYYYDIKPFNFEWGDSYGFKYYKNAVKKVVATVDGELIVHMIDVHQGDSILLQLPDGKNMLIDGGDKDSKIADHIINYLFNYTDLKDSNGKITLDYVMLTHTDADHCGSLDNVIAHKDIDVKSVYRPMVVADSKYFSDDPLKAYALEMNYTVDTVTTQAYSDFMNAVYNEESLENVYYNLEGMTIGGDEAGYIFYFYNPSVEMYKKISTAKQKNNVSPMMLLEFNGRKILLTGDSDEEAEDNFIQNVNAGLFDNGFDGDVDVLKVAHHGGRESTKQELLDMLKPEYAMISCGENTYGHPRPETLEKLAAKDTQVFCTYRKYSTGAGEYPYSSDKFDGNLRMKVDASGNISFDFVADLVDNAKTSASAARNGELLKAVFMELKQSRLRLKAC